MPSRFSAWPSILYAIVMGLGIAACLAAMVLHLLPRPWQVSLDDWDAFRLGVSRVMLVVGAAAGLAGCLRYPGYVIASVRKFFTTPGSPFDLAVLRIVVVALLLHRIKSMDVISFTRLPASMIHPPPWLGWVYDAGLLDSHVAIDVKWGFRVAALFSLCGCYTRISTAITALTALYLFALPHFDGKVDHQEHVLIWFIGLLAVSRCGDALSVDAWRSGQPRPADSILYALPLRFCWLLLGLVYFFPGFWKFWNCGLDWAFSSHLQLTLYRNWAIKPTFTPLRVDRYPWLLMIGGLGTLVFELGFVGCLFSARARSGLIALGQLFHLGVRLVLGIPFAMLQCSYVCLVPWSRLLNIAPGTREITPSRSSLLATVSLGTVLVLGNLTAGILHEKEGYPLSCFPTFDGREHRSQITRLEMIHVGANGESRPVHLRAFVKVGAVGASRIHQRILKERDPVRQRQQLQDLKQILRLSSADRIELYEVKTNTDPDAPREIARRRLY